MRASRSLTAGVAVALAVLVTFPLVVAHVAGAAPPAATGPRPAIAVVDRGGATAMLADGTGRAAMPWLMPGDTGLAVSRSGRRLAFSSARTGNREIYAVDIATGAIERLTWTPRREDVEPAWSPDGSQVVWASGTKSNHDLHAIRIDRTRPRRLTSGPADDREPAWSPDGRTVAFASNEQGAFDLFVVVPRGGGRSLFLDATGEARAPDWHPSGSRLAYTGIVGANADVWVAGLDGTSRELIASSAYEGRPDWSPDGRSIGFLRGRGTLRPWLARASGRNAVPIARDGRGVQDLVWARIDASVAPARSALLPDLDQRPPSDLVVGAAGRGRHVLGFTSATDNVGHGPIWLRGRRSSVREPMLVQQLVRHVTGGIDALRGVGVLRYELHPPHRHWHLDDFVRYELRSLDGEVVVRDRKSGFCLIDRWGYARPFRGLRPPPPRFVGDCATLQPNALRVEEGSSVGYTDRYPAFFHGQDLELTGLPPGRYLLVQTANPERRLRELDYGNNAASALLRVSWPAGRRSAPRVDVLRRCGASAVCPRGGA
jgi:WD40-like Beta Propeller Repeat/Lysyl oxidase